ncbi:MAG: heme lyase CcmF/NrfE family subunit [Myxococcales bacterium]|nr:heme lyase CcmF/NrfE family subunit [Myxococcales bacterium]
MLGYLGMAFVLLALVCAAAGAIVGFAAGKSGNLDAVAWTRRLGLGYCAGMFAATVVMEYALLTHDFSVRYVAQVGSMDTPAYITFVSLWSSLEGSILFWGFVLAGYIASAIGLTFDRKSPGLATAIAVWLAVGAFFCFLMAGPANPFLPLASPVPVDGPGPNPLLQNHILMVVHPPMLYLGYVGMTIPFGFAVSSLMRGSLGAAELRELRNALLVPWGFLSVGIVLGAWWAYEVLGWGGYWAWDPVENASLLPWLTATAALHAAMLPARRGTMKGWTTTLILVTFLLTLLGTFMTRSGVFNSVHSFSQSDIGPTFLVFIAIVLVFSVVLLGTRIERLEGEGEGGALLSRESAFLLNNLLFVALTFTVFVGTTYPLLAEAIRGVKVSVGEPYYNQMAVPLGVAILFLMGVGPALPWGQPTSQRLKTLLGPLGAGVVALGLGWALNVRSAWPLAAVGCAGFASAVTLIELVGAFRIGFARQSRRIGGYTVHAGIIIMLVAVAMSSAYRVDKDLRLIRGQSVDFEGYSLTYTGAETVVEPHRSRQYAHVDVRKGGAMVTTMSPAQNVYPGMGTPIGAPAVHTTAGHDLYLSLMSIEPDTIGIQAFRTPLIVWLWVGGGIVALGALISLAPLRAAAPAFAQVPLVPPVTGGDSAEAGGAG